MAYDLKYWDLMLLQNSDTARSINKIRWNFVKRVNPKRVLDYGSGPGWFRVFAPKGIKIDTYDIAPWPQTGIKHKFYDLITFWDVIEHFKSLDLELKPLLKMTTWIAGTMPILPNGQNLKTWKHYKPGEHYQYLDEDKLVNIFNNYGFKLVKLKTPECPPRSNISSFLFKKKEHV